MSATIIQFPNVTPRVSNAYDNLSRLFSVANDTEILANYAEVMQVCEEDGYFLPGEAEKLTEQLRSKRLELSRPEKKPAVEAKDPGLYLYCPEMGEQKPKCQIEANRSYYGKHFHLFTPLELKGRGITKDGVCDPDRLTPKFQYRAGWNEYTVTERAFNTLQEKYTISQESLLD